MMPPPSRSEAQRDPPAAADTWTQATTHHDSDAPRERCAGQAHAGAGGPEPPTATADCSDPQQSDAAARAPPAASAVILHRHALESIFAFLGLSDLAAALRVSRDWTGAVGSMRRLELQVGCPASEALVVEMAQSAMGRHVAGLEGVRLDAETLGALAARMAHLRHLHGELKLWPAAPLAFPANLRHLDIQLFDRPDAAPTNALIRVIARLPLLEQLRLRTYTFAQRISFAPLTEMLPLRRLDVGCMAGPADFSEEQVDELRALPRLQQLCVPMSTPLLRRLLRQPHDLRWQQVSLPYPLDDETAALLTQLPSLTHIDRWTTCARFDWLAQLVNLTDIRLSFADTEDPAGRAESLVAALQCCTNIEFLKLDDCADLTAAHLADLLPRLPRLRELRLGDLLSDSLSFLAQPPMTTQLSRLDLWNCQRLPLAELRHVHSLRGLTHLTLCQSFTAPLDEESRSQLAPPSLLLPRLEKFEYEAR